MEQFSRIELLLGAERLQRLRDSSVLIVGLGAVGSYSLEALARAGIGTLRVVDFDNVHPSNINRNLLALHQTVDAAKVDLAVARVRQINPVCRVEGSNCFAMEENFAELFSPQPDMLIDAIDSLNPKVQLLIAAHQRKIPVISSMGAALRTDLSQIVSGDLFASRGCPLASSIRKRLRRAGIDHGIFCVYSREGRAPIARAGLGAETSLDYPRGRERRQLGSLPTIPGIFGLMIAHYAIERLCGGFTIKEHQE